MPFIIASVAFGLLVGFAFGYMAGKRRSGAPDAPDAPGPDIVGTVEAEIVETDDGDIPLGGLESLLRAAQEILGRKQDDGPLSGDKS